MAAATAPQTNMAVENSPQWEGIRRQMHQAIDERNDLKVQQCLQSVQHLRLWLRPDTKESAMHRAVEKNAFFIYGMLLSHKCDFNGESESECLCDLKTTQRAELQRQRFFVTKYKNSYIMFLKSRTESQTKCEDFETKVDHMYQELDSIELVRPILKVASTGHHVQIRFDFGRNDVQPMVGCRNGNNIGITDYEKEDIFIGAKTEEAHRASLDAQVLGTLAHEFCHFALHLVYRNGGKPYSFTDVERKRIYLEIVEDIAKRREGLDEIIELAFRGNKKEEELIVRIPHILALYSSPRCENSVLESQVPKLLDFYKEYIIPDMIKYIQTTCPRKDTENIKMENARLGKAHKTEKLEVTFDEPLKHQDFEDVPLLILTAPELSLLEILVHDAVKTTGQPYIFLEASQWDDTLEVVLLVNKCNVVLLTCNDEKEFPGKLKLLGDLSDVVGTKVILLVQEHDKWYFVKEAENDTLYARAHSVADIDRARFKNVTQECKDHLRRQSVIGFQGTDYVISLHEVVNFDNFSTCVETTTFLKLAESKYIDIGPSLRQQDENVSQYYVERMLKRSVPFDVAKIREDDPNDVFLFYGCSLGTVEELLPNVVFLSTLWMRAELNKFQHRYYTGDHELLANRDKILLLKHGKPVHLLQYTERQTETPLSGTETHGDHFPFMEVDYLDEDHLRRITDKVVVILGNPGMGKSLLASKLSRRLKEEKGMETWVIHTNLPEKMAFINLEKKAEDLQQLAILCGVRKDGLEFFLFQQSVQSGIPFEIAIIFDAFDEINEERRRYILKIVEFLCRVKVSNVYILSRTIFRTAIEGATHTVPLELIPFFEKDVIEYATKHWIANGATDVSYDDLRKIAKRMVARYKAHIGYTGTPLGNPLFIRMIAELEQSSKFDKELEAEQNVPGIISVFDTCKKFVEYTYKTYVKEKLPQVPNTASAAAECEYEEARDSFYYKLGLLAMRVIFDNELRETLTADELRALKPKGRLMRDVADGRLRQGLVTGLRGGIPAFTHKIFAEFFAARFLFRKITEDGDVDPSLVASVLRMYTENDYQEVMMFLDSFAAASRPLHSAIINKDSTLLSSATVEGMDNLHDKFGRTPLHVAALHAHPSHMLKMLPMGHSLIQKDMFGMTPLMYLDRLQGITSFKGWAEQGALKALDMICTHSSYGDINWAQEIPTVFKNVTTEKDLAKSVLTHALLSGLLSLLDTLLSQLCRNRRECHLGINPHRVDVDSIRDDNGRTLLFFASEPAVLELILPYCDLRAVDKNGYTVLHYQISWDWEESESPVVGGTSFFEIVEFVYLYSPLHYPDKWRITHEMTEEQEIKLMRYLLLRSRTNSVARWGYMLYEPHVIKSFLPHVSTYSKATWFIPEFLDRAQKKSSDPAFSICTSPSDLHVSLFYSTEKFCRILKDMKCYHTGQPCGQNAFETLFPYLNTRDEGDCFVTSILCYIIGWWPKLGPSVLKHLLLRFDIPSTDENCYTAVHHCTEHGAVDLMKLLLPHADVYAKNEQGRTPLQFLGGHRQEEVTELLLRWMKVNKEAGHGFSLEVPRVRYGPY